MEWAGSLVILGSKSQLPLLTLAIAAQQFAWGVEQAYVSRFLIQLGMSPQLLAILWIAGPTCGLIVQPVVGAISDFWVSESGRRRPFMLVSAVVVALGMITFAWARETARFIGCSPLVTATCAVLVIDVAINVCGATSRALIVDVIPESRQETANAWAGRMSSFGHLASYLLCSTNVEWLFGDQIKSVCAIASLLLVLGVGLTCGAVNERYLVRPPFSAWKQLRIVLSTTFDAIVHLDRTLAAIFKVQLFGWYSWFTLLFYGAEWAAEIWHNQNAVSTPDQIARAGSRALLAFSCSATVFSVVLPKLPFSSVALWSFSYLVYTVAAFSAPWVTQYKLCLGLFTVFGFSWAMTCWAPFALTATRIHQLPRMSLPVSYGQEENLMLVNDDTSSVEDIPQNNGEIAGIYLGIHNMAITLPQFLSTFGSFLVFRIMDQTNNDGQAIAVTLQVGSLTSFLAAYHAYKLLVHTN